MGGRRIGVGRQTGQDKAKGGSPAPKRGLLEGRQQSLVELAHDEIQRRILAGELKHGEKLVIDQLAREFGTSLIPVREALARMNAERLVTFEANRGYRVSPPPDPDELRQLFAARLILEVGALEVSLGHFDAELITELSALNDRMHNCSVGPTFESFSQFVKLNSEFHERIIGVAENVFVMETFRSLAYRQRISQSLKGRGIPDLEKLVSEHARILAALKDHDLVAAQNVLRAHIIGGARRMGVVILPTERG
jgi:DNA-binding GntR family transcriptional regulator